VAAAAAVVLLVAFGSLLATGLPIATALMGIGSGLSLIALLGHVFPAPSFSPVVAAMIGLGVGVDYALFIVTRFRGELQDGARAQDAVVTAMRTAGRAVLTAGTTVVIGMLGLLMLRQALLNGVAIAAAATVAMTVLASLTLLPALLGFTGERLARPSRLNSFLGGRLFGRGRVGESGRRNGVTRGSTDVRSDKNKIPTAQRWALIVQRHPVIAAVASAGLIVVLAGPALGMKLSFPDESAQARGTMGYASYAAMAQGFGPGFDAPLIVVGRASGSLGALRGAIAATPGVASVTAPVISRDGQAGMLIAYPATGEQDAATNALVNRLDRVVLPRGAQRFAIMAG
jgi:RND superfamily putative drug exporter